MEPDTNTPMTTTVTSSPTPDQSRLRRNFELLREIMDKLTAKFTASEPALKPQQALAMKALELKMSNASRLSGPNFLSSGPVVLASSTFVSPKMHDPANPCFVQRGMDRKTLLRAERRIRRSKQTGYHMPPEAMKLWQEQLVEDWCQEKSREGLRMLTVPRDIPLKRWASMARAAQAASSSRAE